jgi:hypothetical protein
VSLINVPRERREARGLAVLRTRNASAAS